MDHLLGIDIVALVKAVGYVGITAIVFAETGLLIGFFLPGDSLLFTAGFLASQGYLNVWWLALLSTTAAIIGDSTSYSIGYKLGPRLFKKKDSIWFSESYIERTQHFYEKHGGKTLILARFLPVIRTFAPVLAGVGKMHYATFVFYNITGAVIWAMGMTFGGYFLGRIIPDVDKYLLPIILGIIFVSMLPSLWHVIRDEQMRNHLLRLVKVKILRRKN